MSKEIEWSFYKQKDDGEQIFLPPLEWKGGSQLQDLIKIIEFFAKEVPIEKRDLTKILLYISKCGSGKSGTLLNAAESIGKTIIVTPYKNLQRQYKEDYHDGDKFIIKNDGDKLSVAIFQGRNNFQCPWLKKQYDIQLKIIEANKLAEERGERGEGFVDDRIINMYNFDKTCANKLLPCTRALRMIGEGRKESRINIGCECEHWIPTPMSHEFINRWKSMDALGSQELYAEKIKDDSESRVLGHIPKNRLDEIKELTMCHDIKYYDSVGWGEVGIFVRNETDIHGNILPPVCKYYEQFYNYYRADVIVMNSAKWLLETQMGRKPKVSMEVFDEGDSWLDSHSFTIDISRITIDRVFPINADIKQLKNDCLAEFDMSFSKIEKMIRNYRKSNIIDAKEFLGLFNIVLTFYSEQSKILDDDDTIAQKILDINTVIKNIHNASISITKGKNVKTIKVHIPFPDVILKELFQNSSKNAVITSGTMHDNFVLSNLFGINRNNYNVGILNGRIDQPGKLKMVKPKEGLPKVTYTVWQDQAFRDYYNKLLNTILDKLKELIDNFVGEPGKGKIIILTPAKKYAEGIMDRPDVHVDFANYNRTDSDSTVIDTTISDYTDAIDSSITTDNNGIVNSSDVVDNVKIIRPDDIDIDGNVLRTDKQIILSTRMKRGTDLRDDKCRGLVILKWPMGDISDGYFQALEKRFGNATFWKIMHDRARREAIQYVSRGLRHDNDWEFFASPDINCFSKIQALFSVQR